MALSGAGRAFLAEVRFATLATINPDGSIQQTVMWYELRGDHIMMNTARGRKKDLNLVRDPRVSICVEDGYRFVTVAGAAELIDDRETNQADIRALATRYHDAAHAEEMMQSVFASQQRVSILVPLTKVIENGLE